MATDSLLGNGNGLNCGSVRKLFEVPDEFGGGFMAGAGEAGEIARFIELATSTQNAAQEIKSGTVYHLRGDGSVWCIGSGGHWFTFDAPFCAGGSGVEIATGAMAAGASAEEAVRIACEYESGCALPVQVGRLMLEETE